MSILPLSIFEVCLYHPDAPALHIYRDVVIKQFRRRFYIETQTEYLSFSIEFPINYEIDILNHKLIQYVWPEDIRPIDSI